MEDAVQTRADAAPARNESLTVRVTEVAPEADNIVSIRCVRADGAELPAWQPGAHVDVMLPSGRVRQYSLCGNPDETRSYQFAVLRQAEGRGGSIELHSVVRPGWQFRIGTPRNHFPLLPAARYLFLAGGIGVTPLMPMAYEAARQGTPLTFVYGARSRSSFAFVDRLARCVAGGPTYVAADERGHPNLDSLFAAVDAGTRVYACGPEAMLEAAGAAARRHGLPDRLHIERFAAALPDAGQDRAFDVVLSRSGRSVHVSAGCTLGSVLQACGADVTFSCEEGLCGTCETAVLAGIPEHRDNVLSPEERARNDRMMVCVGRARSACLVLDC